jgi:enolase
MRIKAVRFRAILNSCGGVGIESEITLRDGFQAVASSPRAISPGLREHQCSEVPGRIGPFPPTRALSELSDTLREEEFADQAQFDQHLNEFNAHILVGADILLSLSLAFARASARTQSIGLFRYLRDSSSLTPSIPQPLINIVSGGVHAPKGPIPVQQIMIFPSDGDPPENYAKGAELYADIENDLNSRQQVVGLSASSGMLLKEMPLDVVMKIIGDHLEKEGGRWRIGVDFAAEHLWNTATHRYENATFAKTASEMSDWVHSLIATSDIGFIEDPFHFEHQDLWRRLTGAINNPRTLIVGDDLFASRPEHIDDQSGCANAILLKLNQAQTISDAFKVASLAKASGLTLCASHRSCETNDVAVCDFAVCVGARLIKLGGPRRGDRVAKYNQMLRIADCLAFPGGSYDDPTGCRAA